MNRVGQIIGSRLRETIPWGGSRNLRHTYQTIFVRMIVNAWGSYLKPNACEKYQKVVCISFVYCLPLGH